MNENADYNARRRQREHIRTVRSITVLILMVLLLIGLFLFRLLMLPRLEISKMDYIEIPSENGEPYRVTITSENCSYSAGGIVKWSPVDGTLMMKDGEAQAVLYDGAYGVFMIPDEYSGCYMINEE